MKKSSSITMLFLDIGGVLLTDGWDHARGCLLIPPESLGFPPNSLIISGRNVVALLKLRGKFPRFKLKENFKTPFRRLETDFLAILNS